MTTSPYPTARPVIDTTPTKRCAGQSPNTMVAPTKAALTAITRSCRGTMSGNPCPFLRECLLGAIGRSETRIAGGVMVINGVPQITSTADKAHVTAVKESTATLASIRRHRSFGAQDAAYAAALEAAQVVSPGQLTYSGHA